MTASGFGDGFTAARPTSARAWLVAAVAGASLLSLVVAPQARVSDQRLMEQMLREVAGGSSEESLSSNTGTTHEGDH